MTQVQSGSRPGSCLLASVSTAQLSNLDGISFVNALGQRGSACKTITLLKAAVPLGRKGMFCNRCKSPMPFSMSVFFGVITDRGRHIPHYMFFL